MEEAARERQQRLAALQSAPFVPSAPAPAEDAKDSASQAPPTVEMQAQRLLATATPVGDLSRPVELAALAPRRANWDLKRDLEARLAPLEEQTDAAIKELVRQRLKR